MTSTAYKQVIGASTRDWLDLFLATANRLGAPIANIEKDFWVCWRLNALYHERLAGRASPSLQGLSLSKAYGLIRRFSEDIDVTVFRDDLDEPASIEELEALSNKKRRARLGTRKTGRGGYSPACFNEWVKSCLRQAQGQMRRMPASGIHSSIRRDHRKAPSRR